MCADIRCSIQKVCCLIVYCSAGEMKLNSVISYAKKRVFRAKFVKIFPGGSAPLAPRQGLRPWTPLGAAPPDPCRSSLSGATRRFGRTQNATGSLRSPVGYTTSQNVLPPGAGEPLTRSGFNTIDALSLIQYIMYARCAKCALSFYEEKINSQQVRWSV